MIREVLMILFVTCSTLGSQLPIRHAVTQIFARIPPPTGLDWLMPPPALSHAKGSNA